MIGKRMERGDLCDAAWNTCLHPPDENGYRKPFMSMEGCFPSGKTRPASKWPKPIPGNPPGWPKVQPS